MKPIPEDGYAGDNTDADDTSEDAFMTLDADTSDTEDREEPEGSEKAEDAADKDQEGSEDTTDGDDTEGTDEGASDDALVVKVKVDGEDREFTVGALKRLAGQEASLTRKSQAVAEQSRQVETRGAVQVALLGRQLERAKARFAPYAEMDFMAMSRDPDISQEDFKALRTLAKEAYEEVEFLSQDLDAYSRAVTDQEQKTLREQAGEAIKVLSDPKTGIKGWSAKVYEEITSFATEQGLPKDVVQKLVDPAAIKLIHKAMLYDRGTAKLKLEGGRTKPPQKIVKSTASETLRTERRKAPVDALARLSRSGSAEDADAAFLERFGG